MEKKVALVALSADPLRFTHVFMNAADMKGRGYNVKIIIEGEATKNIARMTDKNEPFKKLFNEVLKAGMVECACKACSNKLGTIQTAKDLKIELRGDMSGHPSLARMMEDGYEVLTF